MSRKQRSSKPAPPPGLVIVDKPDGMTSHDVVGRMRRIMGTRKIGHAGTLDPMATGVLVIGVERATKLLGHLALDRKSYLTTIALGASTTTDDADGDVLAKTEPDTLSAITDADIDKAIGELTGEIQQVPSAVSAVKVNGERAYARVRAGERVELDARPVTVHRFDRLALRTEPRLEIDALVDCSSGTYVRALARDLGVALGVGGHLTALRRTEVGPFGLATARTLEQLEQDPSLSLTLDEAVTTAFATHTVDAATARAVSYGQRTPAAGIQDTYGIVDADGHALAIATDQGSHAKYLVVLAPA
ncbi:MAG: tRNA pseudouridine(55) synthase TruB [Actinophytocola sp.]|nr:tRNA pseudouridine(55) synthase TruB [Actinophytocola sp.]